MPGQRGHAAHLPTAPAAAIRRGQRVHCQGGPNGACNCGSHTQPTRGTAWALANPLVTAGTALLAVGALARVQRYDLPNQPSAPQGARHPSRYATPALAAALRPHCTAGTRNPLQPCPTHGRALACWQAPFATAALTNSTHPHGKANANAVPQRHAQRVLH